MTKWKDARTVNYLFHSHPLCTSKQNTFLFHSNGYNGRSILGARSDGVGVPIRPVDAMGARQVRGSAGTRFCECGRGVSQP